MSSVEFTSGWDASTIITAVLSGLAAITGAVAIFMNLHLQRDQQGWQDESEEKRRGWEETQERSRRAWQEAQMIQTRWDEYKRSLYARFLSQTDRLYETSGELGRVRANLAEDLANHMGMVEDHYLEEEGPRIEAMSSDEKKAYWQSKFDKELAWFKEERSHLSSAQSEIKDELAITIGEIDLLAPSSIRDHVENLRQLSQTRALRVPPQSQSRAG